MSTPPSNNPTNIDLLLAIARLEGKVDNINSTVPKAVEDHEKRIRSVEKRLWAIPSATVVINIIIAVISFLPMLHH